MSHKAHSWALHDPFIFAVWKLPSRSSTSSYSCISPSWMIFQHPHPLLLPFKDYLPITRALSTSTSNSDVCTSKGSSTDTFCLSTVCRICWPSLSECSMKGKSPPHSYSSAKPSSSKWKGPENVHWIHIPRTMQFWSGNSLLLQFSYLCASFLHGSAMQHHQVKKLQQETEFPAREPTELLSPTPCPTCRLQHWQC